MVMVGEGKSAAIAAPSNNCGTSDARFAAGASAPAAKRARGPQNVGREKRVHSDAHNLDVLRHPDTDVLLRYRQAQRAARPR